MSELCELPFLPVDEPTEPHRKNIAGHVRGGSPRWTRFSCLEDQRLPIWTSERRLVWTYTQLLFQARLAGSEEEPWPIHLPPGRSSAQS
jgi:hypothetical protein